jgi:hypothetical protein
MFLHVPFSFFQLPFADCYLYVKAAVAHIEGCAVETITDDEPSKPLR